MTEHRKSRLRRAAHAGLAIAGVLFAGAVVLHWSWNGFAVEILQAPALRFKHALALELLLLSSAAVPAVGARLFAARRNAPTPS